MINISFCRLGRILPESFAGYVLPYVRRDLARAGNGSAYTVLGAMWNGLACGAAVVEWDEYEGNIRSFFIDPKARSRGVAGHLLDLLLEEGARLGKESLYLEYILKDEELAAMDALISKDDIEGLSPLARDFHTCLTAISGKNRILRVIEGQDEYIRRFSAMAIQQENRRSAAHEEHHKLVDLVEQKDLPALEELMRHHIERSKECCLAALKARKQNRDL